MKLLEYSCRGDPPLAQDLPRSRVDLDRHYHPQTQAAVDLGLAYTKRAHTVANIGRFDHERFSLLKDEAERTDPQQRLALSLAWEAMVDSGIRHVSEVTGRDIGVVCAVSNNDWQPLEAHKASQLQVELRDMRVDERPHSADTQRAVAAAQAHFRSAFAGATLALLSGRTSRCLNLTGPTMTIDAGCSGALVAVDVAVSQIRRGRCSSAIAAAVNVFNSHLPFVFFCHTRSLSPSGVCRPYDVNSDGFVRGEGGGALMLMPDAAARREGRRVKAIIKTVRSSHEGSTFAVGTPGGAAYQDMLGSLVHGAGIEPADVSIYESFGLGIAVADIIELEAIRNVFGAPVAGKAELNVTAIHPITGHTDAAIGMGSLVRLVAGMRARTVPPIARLRTPHAEVDLRGTRVNLVRGAPVRLRERPDGGGTLGAVFAHGMGGTNSALLLEVLQSDAATQSESLGPRRPVVLLFSGQGSHYASMGSQLKSKNVTFRRTLEQCAHVVSTLQERDNDSTVTLIDAMMGTQAVELLEEPLWAQLCTVALEMSLFESLRAKGVRADFAIGHSVGEFAAAYAAGFLSLEQAMRIVWRRGNLMRPQGAETPPQSMIAVRCERDAIDAAIDAVDARNRIAVAAQNGPISFVISGAAECAHRVVEAVRREHPDAKAKEIRVAAAYHSPFVADAASALEADGELWRAIASGKPPPTRKTPPTWISTAQKGEKIHQTPQGRYWAEQIRRPVLFWDAFLAAKEAGATVFVEVGPRPVLIQGLRALPSEKETEFVECFRPEKEVETFEAAAGRLSAHW
eukprot:Polyplicarium_translucidae@DN447_c0_g1_i1.p1